MSADPEAAPVESESYLRWKGWRAEEFGRYSAAESVYFSAELEMAGIRSGRVLEIGFGNGGFAAWAKDTGRFEYHGVETDAELIARARVAGLSAAERLEGIAPEHFDAVIAFDVLEHIPINELTRFFSSIGSLLHSGGVLLARVPSGDSPFARHVQHGDLTHRTIIGAGIVHQLALQSQMEVVRIRAPAFPIRGLGLRKAVRRCCVIMLRSMASGFLRIAFFNNVPHVITENMVIVLRKP